jgi:flagellar biosynthesis/type III secretory pathway chaperone
MKPESLELYKKLEGHLDDLVKIYRHLLGVVRKEREILIAADLNDLNENNKSKEAMLVKARRIEEERMNTARELALAEGLSESSKLVDFARHVGGELGERMRNLQSVLELLLKRVKEHNSHNQVLVNSALESVTGAMGSICTTIKDKPTYKKSGGITNRPADSGQLVSKEV